MIQTYYTPESRIISTNYIGKIKALEIIEYVNLITIRVNSDKDFLYLEDHTMAEFDFKAMEIKQITHAIYDKIRNLNSLKAALINLNPRETAFSLIAIRLLNVKHLQAKIFCTKEAAQDWLLMKKAVCNL